MVNSHLNEAQRERLAALESSESSDVIADDNEANDEDVATGRRGGKTKPVRHQLRRTPTETQQARWEAVQQAKEQGCATSSGCPPWGAVGVPLHCSRPRRRPGHGPKHRRKVRPGGDSAYVKENKLSAGAGFPSGPSPGSWAWTETPPESTPWRRLRLQRNSVPRSVPKQRPWPDHQPPTTKPGDIFAFHLRGHIRWTTTPVARAFHPTVNQVLGQLFMVTPRRILITVLGGEVSRESFPPHALVWV